MKIFPLILRTFHLLTRAKVEALGTRRIASVKGVENSTGNGFIAGILGVSKFKQAFSTNTKGQLLVRHRPCACSACMDREWESCESKV
jgi:hypothetical protein